MIINKKENIMLKNTHIRFILLMAIMSFLAVGFDHFQKIDQSSLNSQMILEKSVNQYSEVIVK